MRHIVSATGLCLLCAWPSADAGDTQESYPSLQLGAESSTHPHGPCHLYRLSSPSVSTLIEFCIVGRLTTPSVHTPILSIQC